MTISSNYSKHQILVLRVGLFLRVGFDGIGWIVYSEELWGEYLMSFRYPNIGVPALALSKSWRQRMSMRFGGALSEYVHAYLPVEEPQLSEFEHLLLTPKYREANRVGKTFFEQGRGEGQLTRNADYRKHL